MYVFTCMEQTLDCFNINVKRRGKNAGTIVGQVIFFLIPDWKGMKKDK